MLHYLAFRMLYLVMSAAEYALRGQGPSVTLLQGNYSVMYKPATVFITYTFQWPWGDPSAAITPLNSQRGTCGCDPDSARWKCLIQAPQDSAKDALGVS